MPPVLNRKFIKNVGLNTSATVLYVVVLQLLIFPGLSRLITIERFGEVLIAVALINGIGMIIGGAMAQVVLKDFGADIEKDLYAVRRASYNGALLLVMIVVIPATGLVSTNFFSFPDTCWVMLATMFFAIRTYLIADLRVAMNYRLIAISRILVLTGYGFGFVLFLTVDDVNPIALFLLGELISVVFVARVTAAIGSGVAFHDLKSTFR